MNHPIDVSLYLNTIPWEGTEVHAEITRLGVSQIFDLTNNEDALEFTRIINLLVNQ